MAESNPPTATTRTHCTIIGNGYYDSYEQKEKSEAIFAIVLYRYTTYRRILAEPLRSPSFGSGDLTSFTEWSCVIDKN